MAYIKNISHEEVLHLADQVSADKGQIVSKTLAQNDHVSVTLFAFSKDEEIAEMLMDIQLDGEDTFKHRLISALARLDENGWKTIEKFVDDIIDKNKAEE